MWTCSWFDGPLWKHMLCCQRLADADSTAACRYFFFVFSKLIFFFLQCQGKRLPQHFWHTMWPFCDTCLRDKCLTWTPCWYAVVHSQAGVYNSWQRDGESCIRTFPWKPAGPVQCWWRTGPLSLLTGGHQLSAVLPLPANKRTGGFTVFRSWFQLSPSDVAEFL